MAPSATLDIVSKVDPKVYNGRTRALLYGNLCHTRPAITEELGHTRYLDNGWKYFDASGGAAVASLGCGNLRVMRAKHEQEDKVGVGNEVSFDTDISRRFARALVDSTDGVMTRAYICNSGSEAMEAAAKLATQYQVLLGETQRTKFIARKQSYHGATMFCLALGHHKIRRAIYEPLLSANVSHVSPCNPYHGKAVNESDEQYVERLAEELRQEFIRLGGDRVIAFVAETVVGAALGCVPPVPGYFKAMRKVCDEFGALMIADEVMCGSGRCGGNLHAWQQEDGYVPDLVAMGKGLSGGYAPIGAVLAHSRVVHVIQERDGEIAHGQTFQGHPGACAAGLETLNIFEEEGLLKNVSAMGDRLSAGLKQGLETHPHVGNIRGRGLFQGILLVKDKDRKEPYDACVKLAKRLSEKALAPPYGLYFYTGTGSADDGIAGDHLILSPAYNVTANEVDHIVDTVVKVIHDFFDELDEAEPRLVTL